MHTAHYAEAPMAPWPLPSCLPNSTPRPPVPCLLPLKPPSSAPPPKARAPTAACHHLAGSVPTPGRAQEVGGSWGRAASTHHLSSPTGQAWDPLQLQGPGSHPTGQLGAPQGQQAARDPLRPV